MPENRDELSNRVIRLIRDGTSEKLMRGSGEAARRRFTEAYELARRNPGLDLWRCLCAYRLGHLALRRDPNDRSALEEALARFREATQSSFLGPFPWIYCLPVLHRLGAPRPQVEDAYRNAVRELRLLKDRRGCLDEDKRLAYPIHDHVLNLVELSSHFLGLDYEALEGQREYHSMLFSELAPGGYAYIILDSSSCLHDIAMAYPLAREEFRQRAVPGRFSFELPDRQAIRRREPQEDKRTDGVRQSLHILAFLLNGRATTWTTILEKVCPETTPDAKTQARRRFRTWVKDSGLSGCFDGLGPDSGQGDLAPRVKEGAPIVGLVRVDLLEPRHR